MGKAQSKRSVDITTEAKKGDDEVTEKMEKIEDTDRKEVNGDATVDPQTAKKDTDDTEIDKDTTTEKNDDSQAGGDSAEPCKSSIAESTKEDGTGSEEISPLTDENAKKSKKEKVKKKWSFRSISFGKKDKQKPLKAEESNENTGAATNGTDEEKSSQETDESQKEKETADNSPDGTSKEVHENGTATEQEKTELQTEEMSPDVKINEETGNATNPTAEKTSNSNNDTAEIITSQETDITSNTPSKPDVVDIENKSEENALTDASKIESVKEVTATVIEITKNDAADEVTAENKNIPADTKIDAVTVNGNVDEIHHNGSDNLSNQDVEESKAQIEVKTNTDNKASADSLEIISSSSYNDPPNVQIHEKHVNALGENIIEVLKMDKEVEHDVSNSLDELGNKNEISATNDEKNMNVQEIETEHFQPSVEQNLAHEPSPPPLPISPPPSHVSVFAFTNKEDAGEDVSEKTESISTEVKNVEKDHQLPETPLNSIKQSTDKIESNDVATVEIANSETVYEERVEENNVMQNNDDANSTNRNLENPQAIENKEFKVAEEKIHIEVLENEISNYLSSDGIEENYDKTAQENVRITNEGNQEDMPECITGEHNVDLSSLSDDLIKNCENEILNFENNVQSEAQPLMNTKNDNETNGECEIENILQTFNLDQSQANDEITQLNTHQEEQLHDKTVSNKIDNLVREETKEIPNAKDLKESSAVVEVTQDPAVTCE